jgi:hypothetical protein
LLLTRLPVPARDPNATGVQIDLAPYYSYRLDQDPDASEPSNSLQDLSAGLHQWNGVVFDVRGVLQLGLDGGNMQRFSKKVEGIPIGQKCRVLHIVGGVRNANGGSGDEVLRMVVRYADGSVVKHPFRLVADLSDWWISVLPAEDKLVWTGTNPASRAKGLDIGVYHVRWENLRRDQPIDSVSFEALNRAGAPFVVALTVEP